MHRAPRYPHLRLRARFTCAGLVVLACAALATGVAGGASTDLIVNVDIPSSTTLVTTACAPNTTNVTNFGIVTPGSVAKTSDDCTVTFGSQNDTASLRMSQSDGVGSAMGRSDGTWTRHAGSSARFSGVDIDPTGATTAMVGASGILRRSVDDGASWTTLVSVPGAGNPENIVVTAAAEAWVGGSSGATIQRTTNLLAGSPTWSSITPGITVEAMTATTTDRVWVVGWNGAIRSTTNGTAATPTWTVRTYTDQAGGPNPAEDEFTGVHAMDDDSVVAFGTHGRVVATLDGTTWRDISMPVELSIRDAWLLSDTSAVVVGQGGQIWTTTNATAAIPTWTMRANTGIDLYEVHFSDALNGYVVGDEGTFMRTSNAGVDWSTEDIDTSIMMDALTLTAPDTLVAGGAGSNIVRSTDGGATWVYVNDGNDSHYGLNLAPGGPGWRVGNDGHIDKTTTAGSSWTGQVSTTNADLWDVRAFTSQRASAVGRDGTIVTTSNGGTNWSVRPSGTTAELRAIDTFGNGIAMAVGANGTILRSDDFGMTWTVKHTAAGVWLKDVEVLSSLVAVAAGRYGIVYRTTDGGTTWSTIGGLPTFANDIHILTSDPASNTVFYQAYSTVARSTDGGATWATRGVAGTSFNDMDHYAPNLLIGVASGQIRQSTNGGTSWTAVSAGSVTFHWVQSIQILDESTVVVVGDGNMSGGTAATGSVDDYVENTSDWYGHGSEAFAACLRATTATAVWTPNGTCDQSADGPHWHGIPALTDATSEVASTSVGDGNRTASLRFGLRVSPTEPPGTLTAGITFVVVSPDV